MLRGDNSTGWTFFSPTPNNPPASVIIINHTDQDFSSESYNLIGSICNINLFKGRNVVPFQELVISQNKNWCPAGVYKNNNMSLPLFILEYICL